MSSSTAANTCPTSMSLAAPASFACEHEVVLDQEQIQTGPLCLRQAGGEVAAILLNA